MDELRLREGEPIKLKRGQRMVPMISVDIPVEIEDSPSGESKQKTYMLKFICQNGCLNHKGKPFTVRMTAANALPGASCGACLAPLVEVEGSSESV